ncbi:MAG: PBP1A family penicillin-binding protein [Oscillospiraceae bacterium]|nr:PBP1A family penicillin-binding protein [Oscillospiraceae bacterium]
MASKDKKKKSPTRAVANGAASAVAGVIGTVFRVIGTVLLVLLVTGLLFMCIFAYYVKTCLSPEMDVKLEDFTIQLSSSILYQDESGAWQKLVQLSSEENRIWIDYENIPKDIEHAAVAIEDKRFYEHKGVDWYRTTSAFVNMFLGMKSDFGGSTITQQLIKNTTQQDDITVQRKLLEIFQALELEKKYSKEEIMEYYLNKVYFGEGCYGIYTAADTYFGKTPEQLTLAECASIVGITNAPTKYDPFINQEENRKRRVTILDEMYEQGYITKSEHDEAVAEDPVFVRTENEQKPDVIYNYYTEVVISDVIQDLMEQRGLSRDSAKQLVYGGGYQIYSCYDPSIQAIVDSYYTNLDALPGHPSAKGQQFESAIVILDPYTGEIKALSGGTGVKDINFGLNRATGSQRPPGSSIKPIAVYGPAMELGLITQNTKVSDSPYAKLSGKPDWLPKNSGGGYSGVITIRTALQKSLNTVSAQILDKLTPQTSYEFLQEKLGVTSLVEDDCNYAPLALGQLTNGITVREMAQAYSAFVNDGVFTYSRTYSYVTDSDGNVVLENPARTITAFQPNTAWNMADMLYNAVNAGTGSEARLSNMPVGGKTGTTSDNWDRWFVGFTPYYVAAVWTGYDMPEVMNFSGNPASQIWRLVMAPIHENLPYKDFPTPEIGAPTGIFGSFYFPTTTPKPDEGNTGGDTGNTGGGGGDTGNTGGGNTGGGGGGDTGGVVL